MRLGKEKLFYFSLFWVAYAFFYIFPNMNPIFNPAYLPLLPIDSRIPFVSWSFLIYLSDYLFFILILFLIKDYEKLYSFVRCAFSTLFICGFFFIFFPTTYPRPEYPESTNILVSFAMNLIRSADTPNNCFPSMHVAMTSLGIWVMRNEKKTIFSLFLIWGVLIILSTLSTKQHYFVDVISGIAVMALVVFLDWLFFIRKNYQVFGKIAD